MLSSVCRSRYLMFLVVIVLGIHLPSVVCGATAPMCALVTSAKGGFRDSSFATLLEAKLLASGLALVEREAIREVLKEQELNAFLKADGVGSRIRLGQLLKADLLIILAAIPESKEHAQLVVCDSASGVRVAIQQMKIAGKPEAIANEMLEFILAAVKRSGESRALVAVPPFVSKDLVFDFDAMKAAYAALVERAVFQSGFATIELAESQSLERELQLDAKNGQKLVRPLPFILLGEYRHEGTGEKQSVDLTLRLKQGEKELAKQSQMHVSSRAIATSLAELTQELLRAGGSETVITRVDPKTEIKQLMQRALDFERIGDWQEAADMYEACLLLEPKNSAIRIELITALRKIDRRAKTFRDREKYFEELQIIHARERHVHEHMETLASQTKYSSKAWQYIDFEVHNLDGLSEPEPRIRKLMLETQLHARNIVLRLIRQRLDTKNYDGLIDRLCMHGQIWWQVDGETKSEAYDRLFQLASEFGEHPLAKQWIINLTENYRPIYTLHGKENSPILGEDGPEIEAFVNRLIHSRLKSLQQAGLELQTQRRDAIHPSKYNFKKPLAEKKPEKAILSNGPVAKLLAIDFEFDLAHGVKENYYPRIHNWFPTTPGTDVLCTYFDLCIMKKPGVAKVVWASQERSRVSIESACYDGKYVWASGRDPEGHLVLLDPQTEQVWEFSKQQGVLSHNSAVALAPISPGKFCMSGGFHEGEVTTTEGRGWVAIVMFTPELELQVKLIHEAKTIVKDDEKTKLFPVDGAFSPQYAYAIGAGDEKRIIVGRIATNVNHYRCFAPPLIIDPRKETVTFWKPDPKQPVPGKGNGPWNSIITSYRNDLYFAEPAFVEGRMPKKDWKPTLYRASGTSAEIIKLGAFPEIGYDPNAFSGGITAAITHREQLYFAATKKLYYVDPKTGTSVFLQHTFPDGTAGVERLYSSHHFGLVTVRDKENKSKFLEQYYRLELPNEQ